VDLTEKASSMNTKKYEIHFGEASEQSMGGAYYSSIYLHTESETPFLLHEKSVGHALFSNDETKVYFPIWTYAEENYLKQQLAFFDINRNEITIFTTIYDVFEIKSIEQHIISAINSPYYQPKDMTIDLEKQTIFKTFAWAKIDAEIVEIKQRLAAATGGNWYAIIEGRDQTGGSSFIMTNVEHDNDVRNPNRSEDFEISGATDADMDFIAHARQDIPMLLAEIERLKSELKN
jgi:S-adenosylmethionine synthetase